VHSIKLRFSRNGMYALLNVNL